MPAKKPYRPYGAMFSQDIEADVPIVAGPPRANVQQRQLIMSPADPENRPGLPGSNELPNGKASGTLRPQPVYPNTPGVVTPKHPVIAAPIMQLTASVLLAPGASQPPNVSALRAPPGYAMLIDEIKFEVAALGADNNSDIQTTGAKSAGMLVGAQFKLKQTGLDDILLSAGMVPVAMFAPSVQFYAENVITYATYYDRNSHYSWRPKTPIYVPVGALLEPGFENRGFLNLNLRVRVSYSVRIIPPAPVAVRRMPYVMAWQTAAFTPNGTEVENDSTEKDLTNTLGAPIEIEGIFGRVLELYAAPLQTPPVLAIEGNDFGVDNTSLVYYAKILNQTKLQLSASWGVQLVRNWIPWAAAFDMWTRSIPAVHEMPPGAYYLVQVKSGGVAVSNAQHFACVSMVGSREVSL